MTKIQSATYRQLRMGSKATILELKIDTEGGQTIIQFVGGTEPLLNYIKRDIESIEKEYPERRQADKDLE